MSAVNYPVMLVESRKSKAIRWDDPLEMSVLKLSAKLIERGLVIFATLGFPPRVDTSVRDGSALHS
jgi:hypothetical protein